MARFIKANGIASNRSCDLIVVTSHTNECMRPFQTYSGGMFKPSLLNKNGVHQEGRAVNSPLRSHYKTIQMKTHMGGQP